MPLRHVCIYIYIYCCCCSAIVVQIKIIQLSKILEVVMVDGVTTMIKGSN